MMPDHIHVVVSIPPRIAISAFVQQLKGESSHLLNHGVGREGQDLFRWQSQYGVVSFGERSLTDVVAYVQNQRTHHSANRNWRSCLAPKGLRSFSPGFQPRAMAWETTMLRVGILGAG